MEINMNPLMTQDREISTITFDDAKTQLLKDTICKGSTDNEFHLFKYVCERTGLDPFMKQIHPVKRWDSSLNRESMTFQTGIDGYRLIAERTGKYVPGKDATFTYDDKSNVFSATAYVKKRTNDGQWHEISATAYYKEYVALKKNGEPTTMWATKPHIMLGKCAEALALRKAFPNDLSGIYTKEEMEQADNVTIMADIKEVKYITKAQVDLINLLITKDNDKEDLTQKLLARFPKIEEIPADKFEAIARWIKVRQEKQIQEVKQIEVQAEEISA